MKLYRFITGPDDSHFCHRVSKALSNGWELAGSPTLTWNGTDNIMMCGQSVTKDVPDKEYHEHIELGDY